MEYPILRDLGFILAAAALVGLAARSLKIPLIVAYIAAGLVLGPVTGLVHVTETLHLTAEIGIALLLFLVGLELSLEKIRAVGSVALVAGGGQIVLTLGLGYGLALLLGFAPMESALLALGLTFSSTVVVVKLLQRKGELDALHGRIALGILLVQDVAVAVSLTLLAGLGLTGSVGVDEVGMGLLRTSAGMLVLLAAAYVAVRFLLPPLFEWLGGSLEAQFIHSLTWCFGFILAAQALDLSVEIGAFVAGVGLAQLPHTHELVRRVNPLVNFFLAVFFVTLGIEMELGEALAHWPSMIALSAFVLLVKPAILLALVPRFGIGERASFLAAISLGQISEFSFVVAALGVAAGLMDETALSVLGAVGLLTIGTSAALIQGSGRVHTVLRGLGVLRPFRARSVEPPGAAGELRDHVIVVGMNTLGRKLVEKLLARGEVVLAVDVDQRKLAGLPCATLQGNTDHVSVLEEAGLARAKLVISALQIEEANNLLAYRARRAGVPSSVHAFDPLLVDELREHGATHLMVSKYDGIRQVAGALRDAGVIAG